MKRLGVVLLMAFSGFMVLNAIWHFYIPPWASAQIFGADLAQLMFIALFGWGFKWCWITLKGKPAPPLPKE